MNPLFLLAAGDPFTEITSAFGVDLQKFISQVVLFLLVAFCLKKFAFGPIQKTLEDRREKIAQGLANAERTRSELANAQSKAQELLSQAGVQANKIIEEARTAAARVGEQERQKAVADAQNILAKAREAGDAELARLKGELRKEFGRLVVEAAARTTGDLLTPDQKGRIADESIRQLSA